MMEVTPWKHAGETDVGRLWKVALVEHGSGVDDEGTGLDMQVQWNAAAMTQMRKWEVSLFTEYRHGNGLFDTFRRLLARKAALVRVLAGHVAALLNAAFPPANAVLGTFTHALDAAQGVSNDYDGLESGFGLVRQYQDRLRLLEGRLRVHVPPQSEHQGEDEEEEEKEEALEDDEDEPLRTALLDVFSATLRLYDVGRAYRRSGRLAKWADCLVDCPDPRLEAVRHALRQALDRLEAAALERRRLALNGRDLARGLVTNALLDDAEPLVVVGADRRDFGAFSTRFRRQFEGGGGGGAAVGDDWSLGAPRSGGAAGDVVAEMGHMDHDGMQVRPPERRHSSSVPFPLALYAPSATASLHGSFEWIDTDARSDTSFRAIATEHVRLVRLPAAGPGTGPRAHSTQASMLQPPRAQRASIVGQYALSLRIADLSGGGGDDPEPRFVADLEAPLFTFVVAADYCADDDVGHALRAHAIRAAVAGGLKYPDHVVGAIQRRLILPGPSDDDDDHHRVSSSTSSINHGATYHVGPVVQQMASPLIFTGDSRQAHVEEGEETADDDDVDDDDYDEDGDDYYMQNNTALQTPADHHHPMLLVGAQVSRDVAKVASARTRAMARLRKLRPDGRRRRRLEGSATNAATARQAKKAKEQQEQEKEQEREKKQKREKTDDGTWVQPQRRKKPLFF